MRPFLIGLTLFVAPSLAFIACTQDPTSSASSATSTSSTTSTSGTGGAPNCEGVYLVYTEDGGNPCNICLHDHCCAEIAVCRDDKCIHCANNGTGPGCSLESKAADDCANTRCLAICSPGWDPPTSSSTGGSAGSTTSSASGG